MVCYKRHSYCLSVSVAASFMLNCCVVNDIFPIYLSSLPIRLHCLYACRPPLSCVPMSHRRRSLLSSAAFRRSPPPAVLAGALGEPALLRASAPGSVPTSTATSQHHCAPETQHHSTTAPHGGGHHAARVTFSYPSPYSSPARQTHTEYSCRAKAPVHTVATRRTLTESNILDKLTHSQWSHTNRLKQQQLLLAMQGIETNPGPSFTGNILLSHVNINSITSPNRKEELSQYLFSNNIDIVALTETKLDDCVHPSLYYLDDFHAPLTKHRNRHGGGVALYIKNSLPIKRLHELELPGEEWIWAEVHIRDISIIICCIYLPPNATVERQNEFIDRLTESTTRAQIFMAKSIILLGDMNVGNIFLNDNLLTNSSGITPFDMRLKDASDALELTQLVNEPTRVDNETANLRDLLFINSPDLVINAGVHPPFSQLDHFPIFVALDVPRLLMTVKRQITIWDYDNLDPQLMTNKLLNTDWESILSKEIDDSASEFTAAILSAATTAIPTKIINIGNRHKPWMNKNILRNIRKRDRLFKVAKQQQREVDWQRWKSQRNHVTEMNRRHKEQYIQSKVNQLLQNKHSPHKYHKILKSVLGRTTDNSMPPIIDTHGNIITEDAHKADILNNYFASQSHIEIDDNNNNGTINNTNNTYNSNNNNNPNNMNNLNASNNTNNMNNTNNTSNTNNTANTNNTNNTNNTDDMNNTNNTNNNYTNNTDNMANLNTITIEPQEVLKMLNSLDVNKSCGPDDLPPKILKLVALLIYEPLTILYNKCLREGIYPAIWKQANVHPIYKRKGSPSDPTNYRPISILPCLSKVFGKIVFKHIYEYLTHNNLLSQNQSGYRPGHSTQVQLLYLTHDLYSNIDSNNNFTAIFLDISKYFDRIWHKGLLMKCEQEFGITGQLLKWLESYLKDRKQRVQLNNNISSTATLNAGCPQGSVLGPLLALMYLNQVVNNITNKVLLFADDISLYAPYNKHNLQHIQHTLQSDLNKIAAYGDKWHIRFNATKTVMQTFTTKQKIQSPKLKFGEQPVRETSEHKHLGLTFSTDLKFHSHVKDTIQKVNRALSPLYSVARFLPRDVLVQIYTTYIQPLFDYCDVIYDKQLTLYDSQRLQTLQNRAARLTTGLPFRTPTNKLLRELGWDSLTIRRDIHRLCMYFKLINNNTTLPDYITEILPHTRQHDTNRALRHSSTRSLPPNNTSLFQRSFVPATTRDWNKLPESLRTILSFKSFKRDVLRQYGSPTPPTYYTIGTKTGNTLHARLRAGMTNLNAHRYSIGRAPTPLCNCSDVPETTTHFIIHCQSFTHCRTTLIRSISNILNIDFSLLPRDEQIDILLHGTDLGAGARGGVARAFQQFVISSGRLSE